MVAMTEAPIELCCLLRARPGREKAMTAYEDKVTALVPDHGGELLSRVVGDGADGSPHEVHVYRFPGQAALDAYMADPRRLALTEERDRTVAATTLFPVRIA
jgi:antibiotic biosynthesis monooxygenase (ABM) superfamily enzyme